MLHENERTIVMDARESTGSVDTLSPARRIFIADDDRGILKVMAMMLRLEGYEVLPTPYGNTLFELPEDELPDLILLDLWMAGIDGRDICRDLKEEKRFEGIPVILISAGEDLEKAAGECHADDYLCKPFEQEELVGLVRKYLPD